MISAILALGLAAEVLTTAGSPVITGGTAGTSALTVTVGSAGAAALATPAATATASTTPPPSFTRSAGLGVPILFRGECEPRAGCTVTVVGIVVGSELQPIACDASSESDLHLKIVARYFVPGNILDVYARGAAAGTFEITADASPGKCVFRASGHKRNVPSTILNFVALLPDDPAQVAAVRFPGERETDARAIAQLALKEAGVTAQFVEMNLVRRFREQATAVIAIDADGGGRHILALAEGTGLDSARWKIVWSGVVPANEPHFNLVDTLDLGADGHAKILLERATAIGGVEWELLRRSGGVWKP